MGLAKVGPKCFYETFAILFIFCSSGRNTIWLLVLNFNFCNNIGLRFQTDGILFPRLRQALSVVCYALPNPRNDTARKKYYLYGSNYKSTKCKDFILILLFLVVRLTRNLTKILCNFSKELNWEKLFAYFQT